MPDDPFAELKKRQREMWASFAPTAVYTTPVAGHLVRFAGIRPGETVLDVGTGTGVVAITARRAGAAVKALDLTPELLAQARRDAALAGTPDVEFVEGDAEKLPWPDASFDVVLSQFGHMFAPRPELTVSEMRRVLKPGGRIAFATWPPEHMTGRFFSTVARHSPPPPPGAAPPPRWGVPEVVLERLGGGFHPPFFERGTMRVSALSPAHYRTFMESSVGPLQKLAEALAGQPDKLAQVRRDVETLALEYFHDNCVHQEYLLTRAARA